jgi:hypothetical protein
VTHQLCDLHNVNTDIGQPVTKRVTQVMKGEIRDTRHWRTDMDKKKLEEGQEKVPRVVVPEKQGAPARKMDRRWLGGLRRTRTLPES